MQRLTIALSLVLGCSHDPSPRGPAVSSSAAASSASHVRHGRHQRPAGDDLARARYHASLDEVFAKTLAVFRAKYDVVEPNRDARLIRTAWHNFLPDGDDVPALPPGTRYFARFEIEIDGPPYAVAITPYVGTWHRGLDQALMLPERRVWLAETVAVLRAKIDRELARYRTR